MKNEQKSVTPSPLVMVQAQGGVQMPQEILETRELSRTEILAMHHPPMINVDDIVSARQTGATVVYIMNTITKTLSPEEMKRRRRQFTQTSWQVIHNLRARGVDV